MGDDFSAEERDILGIEGEEPSSPNGEPENPELEKPEGEVVPEGEQVETEQTPEVGPEYTLQDGFIVYKNGEKIPVDRFEKVYFQTKEAERKLDLLKTQGVDAYYQAYPDEKPEGYGAQPQADPTADPYGFANMGELKVTGGTYDGWTLNEVFGIDPAAANYLQMSYVAQIQEQIDRQKQEETRRKEQVTAETTQLTNQLSQEMFKGAYDALKPEDADKIDAEVKGVIDWMAKTNRLHLSISDAYYLKERDNLINKAKSQGAKETLETIARPGVPSIQTRGGSVTADDYESMTESELMSKIGGMSEAAYDSFLKKASPGLRQKFPDIPWA